MRCLALVAVAVCLASVALGDVVYLKNGGSIEGQVVPTDDGVILKLPAGELRIAKDAIARIETKPSPLDEYQKRLADLDKGNAEAQYKLGLWARANGLKHQAKRHFEKAIAIDPNHAAARQALGFRLLGGKWLSEGEEMRARGLVQYEGQWMTPEAVARLKQLQAELTIAREQRVAAEAELEKARQQAQQPAATPVYGNPYEQYYRSRPSTTYYWGSTYSYPYYRYDYRPVYPSRYGIWWHYPGGRRYIPRRVR